MNRKIGGTVLVAIGVLIVLVAVFFGGVYGFIGGTMHGITLATDERREEFIENAIETVGEVTEVSKGSTTVAFVANEKTYQVRMNVSISRYGEGEDIVVYYNESDPYNCDIPELQEFAEDVMEETYMKFGYGLGAVCLVVGFYIISRGIDLLKEKNK